MTITRNTFEKLATLDKYNVEFYDARGEMTKSVKINLNNTARGGVDYWFFIKAYDTVNEYVSFALRYSFNTGKCSKNFSCGFNFEKRMIRDLQKANLI